MLKTSQRSILLALKRFESNSAAGVKKSPFPTKYYHRKRLQRIQEEQYIQGPPPSWPRCFFPNWNPAAELRAFAFRIDEPMNIGFLRTAFVDRSFVSIPPEEMPMRKMKTMPETDNDELASNGLQRILSVCENFVKLSFSELPQDGVGALTNFLCSEQLLSHLGRNLGMDDMIIAQSYPYSDDVIHRAFCACVEVIAKYRSAERGRKFIEEFVCSQLLSRDIFHIWSLDAKTAEEHVNQILDNRSMEKVEARLLHQANVDTVLPCYSVAFFSQKQFLASGSGETISEAKRQAAINSLRYLLNVNHEHKLPITQTIR